jgi:hypothetical protein
MIVPFILTFGSFIITYHYFGAILALGVILILGAYFIINAARTF